MSPRDLWGRTASQRSPLQAKNSWRQKRQLFLSSKCTFCSSGEAEPSWGSASRVMDGEATPRWGLGAPSQCDLLIRTENLSPALLKAALEVSPKHWVQGGGGVREARSWERPGESLPKSNLEPSVLTSAFLRKWLRQARKPERLDWFGCCCIFVFMFTAILQVHFLLISSCSDNCLPWIDQKGRLVSVCSAHRGRVDGLPAAPSALPTECCPRKRDGHGLGPVFQPHRGTTGSLVNSGPSSQPLPVPCHSWPPLQVEPAVCSIINSLLQPDRSPRSLSHTEKARGWQTPVPWSSWGAGWLEASAYPSGDQRFSRASFLSKTVDPSPVPLLLHSPPCNVGLLGALPQLPDLWNGDHHSTHPEKWESSN